MDKNLRNHFARVVQGTQSGERALHKRLGRLKGELFKAIAYIESVQLMLVSDRE